MPIRNFPSFRQDTLTSKHSAGPPENELESLLIGLESTTSNDEPKLEFCNQNGLILLILVIFIFFVVGLMFMYNHDQFPQKYLSEYPQDLVLEAMHN